MKYININDLQIELEKKKIKNMYLKILPPDGRIHVTAPHRMSETEIKQFILTKLEWIYKQQEKISHRHTHQEMNYISGEDIFYWGQRYLLSVKERNVHPSIKLEGDILSLTMKEASTTIQRKRVIDTWYREALNQVLPSLIIKWENRIGVKSSGFTIRDMKTRWGTCNIRTRNICLSLQLAKKHPKCLEYVVVHELVHLLESSHNSVFKGYMDHYLPDWRNIKKELNGTIS
jgi:predicted metal-dependent hydrolase